MPFTAILSKVLKFSGNRSITKAEKKLGSSKGCFYLSRVANDPPRVDRQLSSAHTFLRSGDNCDKRRSGHYFEWKRPPRALPPVAWLGITSNLSDSSLCLGALLQKIRNSYIFNI